MIRIVHLPPDAPLPDVATWVIIRQDETGQFRLSIADNRAGNSGCCQVGQVETILRPWSAISRAGTWCKINGRSPLVALGGTSLR
jgi:hypothetical protein